MADLLYIFYRLNCSTRLCNCFFYLWKLLYKLPSMINENYTDIFFLLPIPHGIRAKETPALFLFLFHLSVLSIVTISLLHGDQDRRLCDWRLRRLPALFLFIILITLEWWLSPKFSMETTILHGVILYVSPSVRKTSWAILMEHSRRLQKWENLILGNVAMT